MGKLKKRKDGYYCAWYKGKQFLGKTVLKSHVEGGIVHLVIGPAHTDEILPLKIIHDPLAGIPADQGVAQVEDAAVHAAGQRRIDLLIEPGE
jgi:hypothetical protein